MNELENIFDKLGIESMTDRIESAEDINIRFSKFDSCFISGLKFTDGRIVENKRYTRLSETFEKAYNILRKWGYEIDNSFYDKKRGFLCCDYRFISIYSLPNIVIDINKYHTDILHISCGWKTDSRWYKTKDLEKDLNRIIVSEIKKSKDNMLLRELKLKQILS